MSELTGAALLRAAATRCRELDQAATRAPWGVCAEGSEGSRIAPTTGDLRERSRFIGTMNGRVQPEDGANARYTAAFRAVAAPLATWLNAAAEAAEANNAHDGFDLTLNWTACAVARAILAGGPDQ